MYYKVCPITTVPVEGAALDSASAAAEAEGVAPVVTATRLTKPQPCQCLFVGLVDHSPESIYSYSGSTVRVFFFSVKYLKADDAHL